MQLAELGSISINQDPEDLFIDSLITFNPKNVKDPAVLKGTLKKIQSVCGGL